MPAGRPDRIVVKVSTRVLVQDGKLATERFEAVCAFIAELSKKYQVILVTSAALSIGHCFLPLDKSSLVNKQALASIGQPLLMRRYYLEFKKHGLLCSQLLLGANEFDSASKMHNTCNSMEVLLANNVIPIINENDSTALYETMREDVYTDTDRNGALAAHYFDAGLLVILTDRDGYYDRDPSMFPNATLLKVVHELEVDDLPPYSPVATGPGTLIPGSFLAKLKAALYLLERNRRTFLTSGFDLTAARQFLLEDNHVGGTLFTPPGS